MAVVASDDGRKGTPEAGHGLWKLSGGAAQLPEYLSALNALLPPVPAIEVRDGLLSFANKCQRVQRGGEGAGVRISDVFPGESGNTFLRAHLQDSPLAPIRLCCPKPPS
jgi:hypothetical protein